jgi:hypothetical protein
MAVADTSSSPNTTTQAPASAKLEKPISPTDLFSDMLARSSQFVSQMDMQRTWGLSHVAFLLFSCLYLFNTFILSIPILSVSYRVAMLCLLGGYGIALKRHLGGQAGLDMVTLERAFSYDGMPYFCLALMWWAMSRPATITLPFLMVYSVFHGVAWAKDDPRIRQTVEWRQWGEPLCLSLTAHQPTLLFVAAHLELTALPYMTLTWLISSRPSFSQLLFYCQFLRWQHSISPKIRAATKQWQSAWDAAIHHPSCPKSVRQMDKWCREQMKMVAIGGNGQAQSHHHHQAPVMQPRKATFPGAGVKKQH